MAQRVRDVMSPNPVRLPPDAPLRRAAAEMRDRAIGDVLVADEELVRGILTDRDLVVRALAEGRDPDTSTVGEFCSPFLVTVDAEDPVDRAVALMREHSVRRLPVVERGRVAGMVSLGDLAVSRDPKSALADISAATPNG